MSSWMEISYVTSGKFEFVFAFVIFLGITFKNFLFSRKIVSVGINTLFLLFPVVSKEF